MGSKDSFQNNRAEQAQNFVEDKWEGLNSEGSIAQKLIAIHQVVLRQMPQVSRIAIALYDSQTDMLNTFAYASDRESPLTNYQAKLEDCRSLKEVALAGKPRLVSDLETFATSEHRHAQEIYRAGYRSSYTLPMIWEGRLIGFVFFNSEEVAAFSDGMLYELDAIAHMIVLLVRHELASIDTLVATIKSAMELTHARDPETGNHLERMARYSRLIAQGLADEFGFDDQFVQHVFLFAPIHDLGKMVIPDRVLLKKGPLNDSERKLMNTHSMEGMQLVEKLLKNYGLNGVSNVDMLRNIPHYHHEAVDGSGYPEGLKADEIPIEARIIAVADVFDALTSKRPYKEAWNNDDAFAELRALAGVKLDARCVDALLERVDKVIEIQQRFSDQ